MKITVLGPYNSGKSTFIRYLSSNAMSIDKFGTTVAMDHGKIDMFGIDVFLFGTPGLERFDVIRRILSRGSDGIILVVDSLNPASVLEAQEILDATEEYIPLTTPMVLCVNKQDVEGAYSVESIAKQLHPKSPFIATLPTSAKTGLNVRKAVASLVLEIMWKYSKVLTAVVECGQDIKALAKRMGMKSEEETLRSMQWLEWRQLVQADWENLRFQVPTRVKEVIEILQYSHHRARKHVSSPSPQ